MAEQDNGAQGGRFEVYGQQQADGSIVEVTYDRWTDTYDVKPHTPAPAPESPDVGFTAGPKESDGQAVNWGDQPGERSPGGGGRKGPWWWPFKETEAPGKGGGLASPMRGDPEPPQQETPYPAGFEGNYRVPAPGGTMVFGPSSLGAGNRYEGFQPSAPARQEQPYPSGFEQPYLGRQEVPYPPGFEQPYWYNRDDTQGRWGGGSDMATPEQLPFYTGTGGWTGHPNYGNPTGAPNPKPQPSGGGAGVNEDAEIRKFLADPGNAAWWAEFQRAHYDGRPTGYGGPDPIAFYQQPNNWRGRIDHPPSPLEALQLALEDRAWGGALMRERGFGPTDSDWNQHYYAGSPPPRPGMSYEYRGGGADLGASRGGPAGASGSGADSSGVDLFARYRKYWS